MVDYILGDDNDLPSAGSGAKPPRLGFLGAFEASYESQQRTNSVWGREVALREAEQEQISRAKAAGVKLRSLNDSDDGDVFGGFTPWVNSKRYTDITRFYEDGGTGVESQTFGERDREIEELKAKHPDLGLKTYRELWQDVKAKAKEAERVWDRGETTMGGAIGGFLGGAVASMDIRTDPTNFITAPVGAAGRTVLRRIAGQSGVQGLTEAINQFTGVQENRRLLGLDYGAEQGAWSVGAAAAFGGALQGVGEAFGAVGRRWFRNTPNDPAPPPPADGRAALVAALRNRPAPVEPPAPEVIPSYRIEYEERPIIERVDILSDFDAFMQLVDRGRTDYGPSRVAQGRLNRDLTALDLQLNDVGGPRPWEALPAMDTRPRPADVSTHIGAPYRAAASRVESVDEIARTVDPEAFRLYDKISQQMANVRAMIRDVPKREAQDVKAGVAAEIDAQIGLLEAQRKAAKGKAAKRLDDRLAALRDTRKREFGDKPVRESASDAELRERLMKLDEQQRDLAPVISRAYAAAKGEWAFREQIDPDALAFIRERNDRDTPVFDTPHLEADVEVGFTASKVTVYETIADQVPMVASRPEVTSKLGPDADAADAIAAIVAEDAKVLDEAIDQFLTDVKASTAEDADRPLILADGTELDLNERITVPQEDGDGFREITVREYLKDVQDDEIAMQAVTSCSVRPMAAAEVEG